MRNLDSADIGLICCFAGVIFAITSMFFPILIIPAISLLGGGFSQLGVCIYEMIKGERKFE